MSLTELSSATLGTSHNRVLPTSRSMHYSRILYITHNETGNILDLASRKGLNLHLILSSLQRHGDLYYTTPKRLTSVQVTRVDYIHREFSGDEITSTTYFIRSSTPGGVPLNTSPWISLLTPRTSCPSCPLQCSLSVAPFPPSSILLRPET